MLLAYKHTAHILSPRCRSPWQLACRVCMYVYSINSAAEAEALSVGELATSQSGMLVVGSAVDGFRSSILCSFSCCVCCASVVCGISSRGKVCLSCG